MEKMSSKITGVKNVTGTTVLNPQSMAITYRLPGELKPWPGNPRIRGEKPITAIMASIQKFGYLSPIITDENGVILAGHGRYEAAKRLGMSNIPTIVAAGLTEAQKRAYVLADNKIAEMSKWDKTLLKNQIDILIEDDFEIETTGFSTAEIDIMLDMAPEPAPGDPEDLQPEDVTEGPVVSQPGDLWILGNHRLLCGSALESASYVALMEGQQAQMVISDPPYNVPISGHVCGSGKVKHEEFAMASGEMSRAEFTAFLKTFFELTRQYSQDGAIVCSFMDWRHLNEVQSAGESVFGPMRQLCVWVKDNAGMGSFYRSQHELVTVFKKGKAPHINNFELGQHGRYRTNVWNYPGVNSFSGKGYELLKLHPTVKPVGMIADAIRDCSHRKGLILDPFAGSGTILIAAERTGRYARAIELEPKYIDVGVRRWERVTGKSAIHAETGRTFNEMAQTKQKEKA